MLQILQILQILQNLQNFANFQKIQRDNLADFDKCCKTRIYLQRSVPIQPKTSNILVEIWPKIGKEKKRKIGNIREGNSALVLGSRAAVAESGRLRSRDAQLRALKEGVRVSKIGKFYKFCKF